MRHLSETALKIKLYFQGLRADLFFPFLKLLSKLNISAAHLTNLRLILAVLFFILYLQYPKISLSLIAVALFLDMVDGTLARYQHKASDRGKFLDMFVDGFVYSLMILAFLYEQVSILAIGLNILLVNSVYILAIIKKNELNKSDWIIHCAANSGYLRIIPFVAFFCFHLFSQNYLASALWISNGVGLVSLMYYFIAIQVKWKDYL